MASQELTANLPEDHVLVQFTNLKNLQRTAERAYNSLNKRGEGNQFILILGLSKKARIDLDSEEKRALNGVPYRFIWDNTAGIIKVLTSEHDAAARNLNRQTDRLCVAMGIDDPVHELLSAGNTTRLLCARSKGKQSDGCIFPASRLQRDRGSWPTMVMESGVVTSLPRLREEARWWLRNSEGKVRIVLVIGIHRQRWKLVIEKWEQDRAPIHQLPGQAQASLQAHATQTIEISSESESASGAALVLSFEELFDRPDRARRLISC